MAEPRRHPRLVGLFFTVFLAGLISLATDEAGGSFFVARLVVAIQIILGVLLLLFGFTEIFAYARERLRERQHDIGGGSAACFAVS